MTHDLVPPVGPCSFFFNDTATTEIYTLSLHDALPIWCSGPACCPIKAAARRPRASGGPDEAPQIEEHTSELQSPCNLVCRLLLEKKKRRHACLHVAADGTHRLAPADARR